MRGPGGGGNKPFATLVKQSAGPRVSRDSLSPQKGFLGGVPGGMVPNGVVL